MAKTKKERRTIVGRFVHARWADINKRTDNGIYNHLGTPIKNKCYAGVLIIFTRQEFKDWCWLRKGTIESLKRPSIDRLDSSKHYSLDNMQIIELDENIRKDKTVFTGGFGTCCQCKCKKPENKFCKDNRTANGRNSMCKSCDSKRTSIRNKKRRAIVRSLLRQTSHSGTN